MTLEKGQTGTAARWRGSSAASDSATESFVQTSTPFNTAASRTLLVYNSAETLEPVNSSVDLAACDSRFDVFA